MIEKGHGGRVVNVSSVDIKTPLGLNTFYDCAKGGIERGTKAIAMDLGAYDIQVNCICPGGFATPGGAQCYIDYLTARADLTEVEQQVLTYGHKAIKMRMGHPDELARMVFVLCSDLARFVNGATIYVDYGSSFA